MNRVGTLVCRDGLDAAVLAELPVDTVLAEDLCDRLGAIQDLVNGAERLVLVLHDTRFSRASLQADVRAAGIDPLGVQILDASAFMIPSRVAPILAGARARAAAFTGSGPEHAKPVFDSLLSRRSLFAIPAPAYVAAPAIATEACAAADGCRMCVTTCPQDAYRWLEGRVAYDKDACEPCGRCVTACPTGAIESPAVTPDGIRAQIEAIATAAGAPVGIVFSCSRGQVAAMPDDWYSVTVPCTGMLDASWLCAPLLLGAAAVAALPCSATGCDRGNDDILVSSRSFALRMAAALGFTARMPEELTPLTSPPLAAFPVAAFSAGAAPEVFAALRAATAGDVAVIAGPGSPVGMIAIDAETCTMCTMCSSICPTGALRHAYTDDELLTLSFDTGDCTACEQCLAVCPEIERDAIALEHRVDFNALAEGRVILNEAATLTCQRCGIPIAPVAMMDRIAGLLGDDQAVMAHLTSLCLNCRGSS